MCHNFQHYNFNTIIIQPLSLARCRPTSWGITVRTSWGQICRLYYIKIGHQVLLQKAGRGTLQLIEQPAFFSRLTAAQKVVLLRASSLKANPRFSPLSEQLSSPLRVSRKMPRTAPLLKDLPQTGPVELELCRSWPIPQKAYPLVQLQNAFSMSNLSSVIPTLSSVCEASREVTYQQYCPPGSIAKLATAERYTQPASSSIITDSSPPTYFMFTLFLCHVTFPVGTFTSLEPCDSPRIGSSIYISLPFISYCTRANRAQAEPSERALQQRAHLSEQQSVNSEREKVLPQCFIFAHSVLKQVFSWARMPLAGKNLPQLGLLHFTSISLYILRMALLSGAKTFLQLGQGWGPEQRLQTMVPQSGHSSGSRDSSLQRPHKNTSLKGVLVTLFSFFATSIFVSSYQSTDNSTDNEQTTLAIHCLGNLLGKALRGGLLCQSRHNQLQHLELLILYLFQFFFQKQKFRWEG